MEILNIDTGEPREVEVNEDEVRETLNEKVNQEEIDANPVEALRALIQWLRDR